MFAVVLDGSVLFLGEDSKEASNYWSDHQTALMGRVLNLGELQDLMAASKLISPNLSACAVTEESSLSPEDKKLFDDVFEEISKLPEKSGLTQENLDKFVSGLEQKINNFADTFLDNADRLRLEYLVKLSDSLNKKVDEVSNNVLDKANTVKVEYSKKLATILENFANKLKQNVE